MNNMASLFIFRVFGHVAYGLIMQVTAPVESATWRNHRSNSTVQDTDPIPAEPAPPISPPGCACADARAWGRVPPPAAGRLRYARAIFSAPRRRACRLRRPRPGARAVRAARATRRPDGRHARLAAQPGHQVLALGDPAIRSCWPDSRSAAAALYKRAHRPARASGAGHRRQPQCHGAGQGECPRLCAGACPARACRIVSGLALGIDAAAHEGALARRRARTIAVVGTGADLCLSGAQPGARRTHRRRRLHRQRIRAGHAAAAGQFSAPQPHHQRPVARRAGGRGRGAVRLADHRAPGGRAGPGSVRHARLDPRRRWPRVATC